MASALSLGYYRKHCKKKNDSTITGKILDSWGLKVPFESNDEIKFGYIGIFKIPEPKISGIRIYPVTGKNLWFPTPKKIEGSKPGRVSGIKLL